MAFLVERVPRTAEEVEGKHRTWYDVKIRNLSDEPIYDIRLFMLSSSRRVDGLGGWDVLLPAAEEVARYGSLVDTKSIDCRFRDNSGKWWDRRLDGKLLEAGRTRRWLERHFYVGWAHRAGPWKKLRMRVADRKRRRERITSRQK